MKDYKIIPMSEEYIEGFHAAVDSVARERKYLAYYELPPLDSFRMRVLQNLESKYPHFIAVCDDEVVGSCEIGSMNRPIFAHSGLLAMSVIAEYRGKGIGSKLILAALDGAKEFGLKRIFLSVREPNKEALAFYKKIGFVEEGVHTKGVFANGKYEDLISMGLVFD